MPTSSRSISFVARGSLLALLLAACGLARESPGASIAPVESSAAPVAERRAAPGAVPDGAADPAPRARERKLVKSATMRLEVDEYAAAREQLDAALGRAGGHVARARVEHADGSVAFASLELRVPAAALDGFSGEVARLGAVLHEETRADEISDEYYDAQARLDSSRQLERRLLEFAGSKTSDVKQLLEVERELARVREVIESLAGRIAGYDGQVALSALSLEMVSRQRVSVGEALGLGARVGHALKESSGALLLAGRGALVALAFVLPWSPLLVAASYLGRRFAGRRSRSSGPMSG